MSRCGIGATVAGEQRDGQIDVDDLAEGVDPGVRAAGADDQRLVDAQRAGEGFAKDADDRRELGLVGEAGERVAVVGDVQTPALDV